MPGLNLLFFTPVVGAAAALRSAFWAWRFFLADFYEFLTATALVLGIIL